MAEPLVPYGYQGQMITWAQMEAKQTWYKLNPEFARRFKAMSIDAAHRGAQLGVGDGWRIQPDPPPPGFAPPGKSNHEGFPADGVSGGAVAIDTVPESGWSWMEAHCAAYGIRTFKDVNSEPWHCQPSDIPASRVINGVPRSEPWDLPEWPLPGDTPEPVPPLEEDDDMPAPIVITASDGVKGESDSQFWWDGKTIGWVRTVPSLSVGKLTGLYRFHESGDPFTNWNREQIQREINSSWAGGPVPPGYQPPKTTYIDSGVD